MDILTFATRLNEIFPDGKVKFVSKGTSEIAYGNEIVPLWHSCGLIYRKKFNFTMRQN